jgi:hypothetical protein
MGACAGHGARDPDGTLAPKEGDANLVDCLHRGGTSGAIECGNAHVFVSAKWSKEISQILARDFVTDGAAEVGPLLEAEAVAQRRC